VRIDLVSLIVDDYDEAIDFFVNALGFTLTEDAASVGGDGRPKRWVVVRPADSDAGLLLSKASGEDQTALVGGQFAERVGFILHVDDFDAAVTRMAAHGVAFVTEPRVEPYGKVVIFLDVAGNRWDLIGPSQ
jgi:catechol 2,3-dioxygenase-like lactoylglutathione lyase family enzyme